jgi:hypothetical protein
MNIPPKELIEKAKARLAAHFEDLETHLHRRAFSAPPADRETKKRFMIAKYTAAFAVNFTDWIGKTRPWVRSPEARFALDDNQRCEQEQDHVGMLLRFAMQCDATPEREHYDAVAQKVADIRGLFKDVRAAGLTGLVLLAILENTSMVFIPQLERWAREVGCTDLEYTSVHGEADAEHSNALLKASEVEVDMMKSDDVDFLLANPTELAVNLLIKIFSF